MSIVKSEFALALNQVATERGITTDDIISSIETAILAAYHKEFPGTEQLLFDKSGKLLGHIDLFLNGATAFPEELAKPVSDGDTISMLYLIIGG